MVGLISFMNGWIGRILRIVLGLALLWGRSLDFSLKNSRAQKGPVSEDWGFSFGSRCRRIGSLELRAVRWGQGCLRWVLR